MAKNDGLHLEGEGIKEYDRLRKYLGLVYLYGCFDAKTLSKINSRSVKDYYAMMKLSEKLLPTVKANDMYQSGKGKSLRFERRYDASAQNRMTDTYMMASLDKMSLLLMYLRLLQRLQQGDASVPELSDAMDGLPVELGEVLQNVRNHVLEMVQHGYAVKLENAVYRLAKDGLSALEDSALQELYTFVCFAAGVTYPRVPGSFLCRTLERELRRRGLPINEDTVFLLRNNSNHNVFDEEVVFRFLQLIEDRQAAFIDGKECIPVKLRIDCRLGRWYVLVAREYKGTMQAMILACSRLMLPEAFGDKKNPKWNAALAAVESTYPENESLISGNQTEESTLVEVKLCFGEEKGRQQQFCRELRLGSVVTREDGLYYQVRIRDPLELVPLLRAYSPWLQILPGDHDLCKRMTESLQQMENVLDGTFDTPHPTHHRPLEKRSSGGTVEDETAKAEKVEKSKDGTAAKEWKLLSPFQGRLLQFSLDLLADPKQDGTHTEMVNNLAKRYGFSEEEQIVSLLNEAGLFKAPVRPCLPMSKIEREYLQYILNPNNVPEVTFFLSEQTRRALIPILEDGEKQYQKQGADTQRWLKNIQWQKALGMELPRNPGAVGFRKIICAIRERRLISYRYRVRTQHEYLEATCLPWKLEYSAYDRRWWIILYDTQEGRTIKTPLNHLRDIQLLEKSAVTDSAILEAMEKLRMKEPVILHIRDSHNALQRCFIIFENQEITGSDYAPETGYVLKMRAFRFDREEILRQLMYLGPNVRLAEPADLREELRQRLKQARKNNGMNHCFSTDN